MNLENLKLDKEQLEEEISQKINEFQDKYKVTISDIHLITTSYRNLSELVVEDTQVSIEIYL